MSRRIRITKRTSTLRCAFCHDGGDLEECSGCGAGVHLDCSVEAGRCPTLGCKVEAIGFLVEAQPSQRHVAANGALVNWPQPDPPESEVARILREEDEERVRRLEEEDIRRDLQRQRERLEAMRNPEPQRRTSWFERLEFEHNLIIWIVVTVFVLMISYGAAKVGVNSQSLDDGHWPSRSANTGR